MKKALLASVFLLMIFSETKSQIFWKTEEFELQNSGTYSGAPLYSWKDKNLNKHKLGLSMSYFNILPFQSGHETDHGYLTELTLGTSFRTNRNISLALEDVGASLMMGNLNDNSTTQIGFGISPAIYFTSGRIQPIVKSRMRIYITDPLINTMSYMTMECGARIFITKKHSLSITYGYAYFIHDEAASTITISCQ